MEKYNYHEAVKEDILAYLNENDIVVKESDIDDAYDTLYDELFVHDSVTGNASGSYTFNAWQAEEYLCHNLDLLQDACNEFCCEPQLDSAEWCDVTIRCYLLGQCLGEVLDEVTIEDENEEKEEEIDEE
jgi:hypothetical protein